MNITQRCYEVLFSQRFLALFDLPFVLEAPIFVVKTLQQCHQTVISLPSDVSRKVKVRGRKVCHIPGGTIQVVLVTCSAQCSGTTVLFEPLRTPSQTIGISCASSCGGWYCFRPHC